MNEKETYDVLLSGHFRLGELTRSAAAIRHGLRNEPNEVQTERLRQLCLRVLEPLRRRFGVLRITSGFRSAEVNRLVGGVPSSQHTLGEAADIFTPSAEVQRKMKDFIVCNLPYDQLIVYHRPKTGARWLHVSLKSDRGSNRYQLLCSGQTERATEGGGK